VAKTFRLKDIALQFLNKEEADWTFRVPGLFVLLAGQKNIKERLEDNLSGRLRLETAVNTKARF